MKMIEVAAPMGFPEWHCGKDFDYYKTVGKEIRAINGKNMIVLDMPEGAFEMFDSDPVYHGWLVKLTVSKATETADKTDKAKK